MNSLFKIFGGKHYLKDWIISHFPPNYEDMHFVDLFCGSGTITFNKNPARRPYVDIMNDLDKGIFHLLESLKYKYFDFYSAIYPIQYEEKTFLLAQKDYQWTNDQKINLGLNRFILSRMSRAGMCKHFSKSDRLRGGRPEGVNSWENAKKSLRKFSDKLTDIAIFCAKAYDFLQDVQFNEDVFAYMDPPYLHSTRKATSVYKYEMSEADHVSLAIVANRATCKILISGYDSDLYNKMYSYPKWTKITRQIVNHSSQADKKPVKTECLWRNY